jgi:hypothetical protein
LLAIGPKVHRFKPSKGDGFFRAIKVYSMPSCGVEVRPLAPFLRFTACKKSL